METVPTEIKKERITVYLKPSQRISFALSSKKELEWMRPLIEFMNMPMKQKITFLKTSPKASHIMDDIVVEYLLKQHDPVIMISLLKELSDEKHKSLKQKIRKVIEDRIRDRSYKKLIKKTLIQLYFQYLIQEKKSVSRFIETIQSPEVKSFAIEQYLLLKRKDFSPNTLKKWVEKIPDEYTRNKTIRTFRLT